MPGLVGRRVQLPMIGLQARSFGKSLAMRKFIEEQEIEALTTVVQKKDMAIDFMQAAGPAILGAKLQEDYNRTYSEAYRREQNRKNQPKGYAKKQKAKRRAASASVRKNRKK